MSWVWFLKKVRNAILAWLIRAYHIHLIEVKMKNYSSKLFIFFVLGPKEKLAFRSKVFFVVTKSISSATIDTLQFENIFTLGRGYVAALHSHLKSYTCKFVSMFTNLCAIRSHPCHYTELMLISSCILHLKRLLFESLFKIFDCVVPSSCSNEHKLIQKIVLHSFRPDIN